MKHVYLASFLSLCVLPAVAQDFLPYHAFPPAAPSPYGVDKGYVGVAIPDGRLLVWNGEALYLQTFPSSDSFNLLAAGYEGDPGFAALTPNGQTVYLGEGFGGRIYRVRVADLHAAPSATVVANESHFAGAMLTDALLLIDAGKADFTGSELRTVDLSGAKSAPVTVLRLPVPADTKARVVDKPPFSYSSALHVDRERGLVYVMDGNTRELRHFAVTALIAAHQSGTALDWATDGTLVGAPGRFFTGGVAGTTTDGLLVIGGSAGFLQPGGIQIVNPRHDNPALADVVTTLDPEGTQPFYGVIVNDVTGAITALPAGSAYGTDLAIAETPAASGTALALLACMLVVAAGVRTAFPHTQRGCHLD